MHLSSLAFNNNEEIPVEYTCDGEGISPPLTIEDIPENTTSLVLIVEDPDAPGETFTHWIIWNIDPQTEEILEGNVPSGAVQGINSSGSRSYSPPCPPSGRHHYTFILYALDNLLTLSSNTSRGELEEVMGGHIISQSQFIGVYGSEEGDRCDDSANY